MNLVAALEHHACQRPHHPALRFGDQTFSYGETDDLVSRLAGGLRRLGVGYGDRVAVFLGNVPEFHFTTHATWKLGAVEVPINYMFGAEEAAYVLRDSGTRVAVTDERGAQLLGTIRSQLPELDAIVSTSPYPEASSFSDIASSGEPVSATIDDDDSLAVIAYTSGTTGFPKGAKLSHQRMITSIETLNDYLGLGSDDNVLQVLPCFHSNASIIGVVYGWYLGSTAILVDRFDARSFVEVVRRTRPAFFAGVPTLLFDIARLADDVPVDFSSVRFVSYGAASAPARLRKDVERRFGLRLLHAYGMTEAPNIATIDPIDAEVVETAVGRPLPHIALEIVDPAGHVLPTGDVGEICLAPAESASPHPYQPIEGYWNNEKATAAALQGGRFHTGDLGRLDDNGYLYLVDRVKDTIIRGGNNVYPAELERILDDHPAVAEAYVVGMSHERLGEVPKAFVVVEDDATVTCDELVQLVGERVAAFKRLEAVEFIDRTALPRNALGKVLKRELQASQVQAAG